MFARASRDRLRDLYRKSATNNAHNFSAFDKQGRLWAADAGPYFEATPQTRGKPATLWQHASEKLAIVLPHPNYDQSPDTTTVRSIEGLAVSPDGARAAMICSLSRTRGGGWSIQTGHSSISSNVVTQIELWDLKSRRQMAAWNLGLGARTIAFSHDGNLLATSSDDRLTIWNVSTQKEVFTGVLPPATMHAPIFPSAILAGGGGLKTASVLLRMIGILSSGDCVGRFWLLIWRICAR